MSVFNAAVQAHAFTEHPVLDIRAKEPSPFDVVADNGQPTDFLHDGKFSMEQYNNCLLSKLFSLGKVEVKPFLEHQNKLVSDPLTWLYTLEGLIEENDELFNSKELRIRVEKTKMLLTLLIQEVEAKRNLPPSRFDFEKVKLKLKTYSTAAEQLFYLYEMKADYLQNRPKYIDPNEIPFDEKIEVEIQKIKQLSLSLEEVKSKTNPKSLLLEPYMDNHEFIMLMKISKRTAQTWRESGLVPYSQIGNKVYYKVADIERLLNINYFKGLKK
jgi:hypothetical protein